MVNFNTFDLNLVRLFLALWELRNVTAAAERLNLTQPAASHALKRLRAHFSDPLFTRVGKSMVPTEAAERLYVPFSMSIGMLRDTMTSHGSFDPASSSRLFTLAMSDISETYVLPRVLGPLSVQAPGLRLCSVQLDAQEIEVKLRAGQVTLAIGYLPRLEEPEFESTFLLKDRFVCLMRRGHPAAGVRMRAEDLAGLDFVEVAHHATGYQMVRTVLEEIGVKRTTRAQIEHFSVLPEIVRASDLVAIYPASTSARLIETGEFTAQELPFDLPSIDVCAHFHSSFRNDPGVMWFTRFLATLF